MGTTNSSEKKSGNSAGAGSRGHPDNKPNSKNAPPQQQQPASTPKAQPKPLVIPAQQQSSTQPQTPRTAATTPQQPPTPKTPTSPPTPTANKPTPFANSAPAPPTEKAGKHDGGDEYRGAKFRETMTVEDFELLKVVGKGSFGKVMQVKKKDTGEIYAMKVLKKNVLVARKQVAHTQTERRVLEEIDHPFIVSLRFAFQTQDKLYMILDYFTGGELFFHLKSTGRFEESRAKFYAAQIVSSLECLHKHTIVYRDLKPENVLLDEDGNIKLTDFGLSKESVTGTALTHTFCGTPEYLAPEVIQSQGYGQAVDWWSLGTLLYEMLTGLPPFYNENLHVMYERILRQKLTFPNYLSDEAKDFLTGLLDRNPKTRLGGGDTDAVDVKKHPFFADINWDKLIRKEIKPPFKPQTTDGKTDTTYVDDEFKQETPKDTPVIASTLRSKVNFPDFTFAGGGGEMGTTPVGGETLLFGNGGGR
jgi:serine/threonine protein kinase